ncbi:amino acid adenylation domain-containing protein, partial [Corallococcus sp. CA053C]|uniref:non-ribosomal peptide synthase/polyketide synthase n=1 Tax=Corallococcus sp. CA053C TaxID=2316732 RepID=UPI000EA15BCF
MTASSPTASSSLIALLEEQAARKGDQRLYTFLDESGESDGGMSYEALCQRAQDVAAVLQDAVAPGERAVLLYPPGLEYIVGFFGSLFAGLIPVPAYPPDPRRLERTLPRLRAIIQDAQATVVLTTSGILAMSEFLFEAAPALKDLRWVATDELPAGARTSWRRPEAGPETVAFLQYTSGSTSAPKGVMLSHGNLLHNLRLISQAFQAHGDSSGVIWLPPYHDMGLIGGILVPLAQGFHAALMSPLSFLKEPLRWLEAVSRFRGTISGGPNFAYDLCVKRISPEARQRLDLSHWNLAFSGAEPIRPETLDRFVEAFGPQGFRREAFYPCYGLAEATLIVSGGDKAVAPLLRTVEAPRLERNEVVETAAGLPGSRTLVGCGQTLTDQQVFVVDPESRRPCPPGAVGEIWVSGPSIARGYWGRPELSEQTFQARQADGHGPFLRTGDLGFLMDGELFVTGRRKDLIILRGRNLYPQDLELTAEQSHPALRPGCGAAFSVEVDGEERLVLVQELDSRQQADPAEVADALRQRLSEEHQVRLDTLVLIEPGSIAKTSSGKIQRHACKEAFLAHELRALHTWRHSDPAPAAARRAPPKPAPAPAPASLPANATAAALEAWLVDRLAERLQLGREHVDPNVPITRHGLDSLAAMELSHVIEQTLGVPLPMELLLQGPTLSQLAWQLFTLRAMTKPPAPRVERTPPPRAVPVGRELPLSSAQQRLWFLEQLEPGAARYNIPGALRLEGPLDVAALERSFEQLIQRHEALRTTFEARDGQPVQRVAATARAPFAVVDLEPVPALERWETARRLAVEDARRPFALEQGPLLRVTLIRLERQEHLLVVTLHHLVSDGWSMGVLLRELSALYAADGSGQALPEPSLQFGDTLPPREELRAGLTDPRLAWWHERLAGAPLALELPTDRPRPPVQTHHGATWPVRLPRELSGAIRALCHREGVTPFMLLLAAFQTQLHRYTGQTDLCMGTAIAGRNRAELRDLIGLFFNLVVMRTDLSGDPSFRVLLGRARETALGAYAHQEAPFDQVVELLRPERSQRHSPLFQVLFVLQGEPGTPRLPGLKSSLVDVHTGTSAYELSLLLNDTAEGFTGALEYNTDLFDAATAERMVGHLHTLLEGLVAAPDRRLSELPLLAAAERQRVLRDWNQTGLPHRDDVDVPTLFEEQARRTPDAVAVCFQDASLTYRELDARASRVAARLQALGVGREARVGLCVERSLDLMVGLLGVLKAGAAYVPLDPSYPRERLALVLEDTGAPVLVTQQHLLEALPHPGAVLLLDEPEAPSAREVSRQAPTPESTAYVIYTSGSTGRPKGVAVNHRNVLNFFAAMDARLEVPAPGTWLAVTSISFDISVLELLWTLARGFTVVVAREVVAEALAGEIRRHGVTHLQCTPSLARALLQEPSARPALSTLRQWLVGGEALDPSLAVELARTVPSALNMYGPTETTVWSSAHRLVTADGSVPIGTPLANTALYILNASLEPCPVGVAGELYIGGAGVVRGYLHRPELTAERFIPDPFGGSAGARLYRTGDLTSWRADGTVEYLGRGDHQVKVRGFRIELGEIEAVLGRHPSVSQAVVSARADAGGDKQLVAYVVPARGEALDVSTLRAFAQQSLPGYMVPGVFVRLDAFPLTPNGKVDRKALPAPDSGRMEPAAAFVAPRTSTEQRIAAAWSEILGVERVGLHASFFELGGHSLLATQVLSRIRHGFGVELPLRVLFEQPTVAGLAEHVDALLLQQRSPGAPALRAGPRPEKLPLSFAQERLWLFEQLHPGTATYNMPCAVRMSGRLDVGALERSLEEIERRHEALRTVFPLVDAEPVQAILPPRPHTVPVVDLRALPQPEREARARVLMHEEAAGPFDLARGPLLRAVVLRLAEDEHILCLTLHHIVADGWSVGVFVRELAAIHEAFSRGAPSPLRELPLQYADYGLWQQRWLEGEVLEQQLGYWKQRLDGLPRLQLRTPLARSGHGTRTGEARRFLLPADLVGELEALGRREGASLFMVLFSLFNVLLHRHTGQEDLAVGTDIANRNRLEVEALIGLVTNQLVLRTDVSGAPTFRELLGQVRQRALEAYEHQDLPFEKVVRALKTDRDDAVGQPLFQVKFVLENAPLPAPRMAGLQLTPLDYEGNGTAKWDFLLMLVPEQEGLSATLEYRTDLFDSDDAARLWAGYLNLARAVVREPGRKVSALPLLTDEERRRFAEWNATQAAHPPDASVPALFEAWAEQTPDAVAVTFDGQHVTYAELNRRANQVAHQLKAMGATAGGRIGICLERSVERVVGLLGILKAGASYVPLDPAYPQERLTFVMEDARLGLIVSQSELADRLPSHWAQVLCLDLAERELARRPTDNPPARAGGDAEIYVLYTSGSTGMPKGVVVPHRGVVRLVREAGYVRLGTDDRVLHLAPLAFDASTFEIWGALLNGGRLIIFPAEHPALEDIARVVEQERVTTLWLTAGLFHQLIDGHLDGLDSVRQLLAGGDVLSPQHVLKLMDRYPGCQIINGYGPTENTTFTCCYRVEAREALRTSVPIGHPISETRVYLLDEALEQVPLGAPGELFAAGAGVALGYLNQPDLTAERFLPDPFSAQPGARMYRTGDQCRYRKDGALEFIGRRDQQVKIRGFRIEPGEVEAALGRHPSVEKAVVVVRELAGEKALVAYAVPVAGEVLTLDALRLFLTGVLPAFMMPAALVVLDALPLTPNGKVDRRALPEPGGERPRLAVAFAAPRTPREEILAAVWADVLGLESVGSDDNFFALGGDSLRSIQIVAKCRARGLPLSIGELLEHPTVRELAERLVPGDTERPEPGSTQPFALVSPQERERLSDAFENAYPLSMLQAGMLFSSEYSLERALYHDAFSFHLKLALDEGAFREALRWLVARHPVLRTSFTLTDFDEPLQRVHRTADVPLRFEDLRHLEAPAQAAFLARWLEEERCRPFAWDRAPLMRCTVHQRTGETVQFSVVFHHAILDGWSVASMFTELFGRYVMAPDAAEEAPAFATSFQAFIALEREAVRSKETGLYFERLLEDLPRTRPYWLEAGRSASADVPAFHELWIDVPAPIRQGLTQLARTLAVPFKSVLLAAHLRVVGWIEGTADVLTGLVSNGRPEVHDGERVLGLFLNTLPLRLPLPGGTWSELVQAAFQREQELSPHRRYPMALLQQQRGGTPLFTTLFNYVHFHVYGGLSGLEGLELLEPPQVVERLELPLSATFSAHPLTSELQLVLRASGMAAARVEELGRFYSRALESLALNPTQRYERHPLLSGPERQRLLVDWNGRHRELPRDAGVHEAVLAWATRTPDAIAVEFGDARLTYGELERRARSLAHHLRALGVGTEVLVAVCLERSVDMVVALLAILEAGGAYLPLDPGYPPERLAFMIEDAAPAVLLTWDRLVPLLPAHGVRTLCLDSARDSHEAAEHTSGASVSADSLAYVIYTSGSTGQPKGVQVSHGALMNHMTWFLDAFGLGAEDRVLQKTPLSFDAAVWECWASLMSGGRLVVAEPQAHRDVAVLVDAVVRHQVTALQLVPSQLRVMLDGDALARATSLRWLFCGGEALEPELGRRLRALLPTVVLINLYGPTEVTIDATSARFRDEDSGATVPVGRPIDNMRAYVLDGWREPVPAGTPGELYLAGKSVARGYLGRPALSAERFLPDPFTDEPGSRMYRTGDRARHLPDGSLEYLGRVDLQVKVRGFRIEPGEVEAALRAHPGVKDTAVVVRDDGTGPRLVGYFVADPAPKAGDLRAFLAKRLPEHLVPSVLVRLPALPLTPSGKLDRRALPPPDDAARELERPYVAPRTPTEQVLAGLQAELLRVERVGRDGHFFELGGHSLLATRLASRIRATFQVELSVRDVFEAPLLEQLAGRIDALRGAGRRMVRPAAIQPLARTGPLPLSFAQQRLWFLDQLKPGDASYNLPAALRLSGALDVEALRRAFEELVRRHEPLRTTFPTLHGTPHQRIHPPPTWSLPRVDLTHLPEDARETEARQRALQDAEQPFALAGGPLLRTQLLKLDAQEHVLLVCMHHIVSDGWSMGVLVREIAALYPAFLRGQPSPLPELPVQYVDYAGWQQQVLHGEVLEQQVSYWKQQLAGAPALLTLPTDFVRPAVGSNRGASIPLKLGRELSQSLGALARQEGVTPFMLLLAAWQVLLARYAGQDDVSVGSPIAGRTRAETEGLIGFFVNTLVLRVRLEGDPAFAQVLRQVRETTLGAYAHQEVPFEKLVEALQPERSLSHAPLFQVVFAMQEDVLPDLRLPELQLTPREDQGRTAKFDLTLALKETAEGLEGVLEYSVDLFERASMELLAGHFASLLQGIAANPYRPLSQLPPEAPLQLPALRQQAPSAAPAPAAFVAPRTPMEETLAALWAEVLDVPAPGIHDNFFQLGGASLTSVLMLARVQEALGTDIPLERFFEAPSIAALAAALESAPAAQQGSHAPKLIRQPREGVLPLSFAQQRLWFLDQLKPGDFSYNIPAALRLSGSLDTEALRRAFEGVVHRHESLRTTFTTHQGAPQQLIHPPASWALPLVDLSTLPAEHREAQAMELAVREARTPFVLSTGPLLRTQLLKLSASEHLLLVCMHHIVSDGWSIGVLVQEVAALYAAFLQGQPSPLTELPVQYADYAVWQRQWLQGDALQAQLDYWHQRLQGAPTLALPTDKPRPSLRSHRGATLSFALPSHLTGVLHTLAQDSGATLFMVLLAAFQTLLARYSGQDDISVGSPIANRTRQETEPLIGFFVNTLVLRSRLDGDPLFSQLLARVKESALSAYAHQDVPFEQLVEALGVARDLSRSPLFQVAFSLQSTSTQPPMLPGLRVETLDTQTGTAKFDLSLFLAEDAGVLSAQLEYCVDLFEHASMERFAGHFVSLLQGIAANPHRPLSQLPPEVPLQLPALRQEAPTEAPAPTAFVAPRTPMEETLAALWTEVLDVPAPGVHDNFFQLGGTSLSSVLMLARVQEALGTDIPLERFFEAPSIAALAAVLESVPEQASQVRTPPLIRQPREGALPLSFAQQRLWFLDQLKPDDASYNIPVPLRLSGALDVEALRRAFEEVLRRHESLRTVFPSLHGEPHQRIQPASEWDLSQVDLTAMPAEAREAEARERAEQEARRPFHLASGPLLRTVLLKLEEREHVLLVTMHHIVSDGWSMGVLVREIAALYSAFLQGRPSPLPELAVQYADYAVWQRQRMQGDLLDTQLAYWRTELDGAPALLELPTDRPRPAVLTFRGARHQDHLPPEVMKPLHALAEQEKATPYMVLLAAFQVLLSRYSGQDDISVGSPISGRTRPEMEPLVGLFVNTLVMRGHVDARASFREHLRRTRDSALKAYSHQEVPFERLVEELNPERSLGHTPLFQVMLVMQNQPQARLEAQGLKIQAMEVDNALTKFDLTLALHEDPAGLSAAADYNAELFEAPFAHRLLGHLRGMLLAVGAMPDAPLSQLTLLTDAERHRLLVEWNTPRREALPDATLSQLFEVQARRTPDAQAVTCGEAHLSFRELDVRANQLAHRLRSLGIGPDAPVVLCLERSVEALVAILGTLKAGGAYVPVDPSYPREWKEFVLRDTQARVLLTQRHLLGALFEGPHVLCLGADGDSLASESTDAPVPLAGPDNLAYVIYTSGSTGRPKGVMIQHRSVLHLRQALASTVYAGTTGPLRVSVNAPLSFDASVKQLLQVLDGHTLCFVLEEERGDISLMLRRIEQERLDVLDCSPAHLRLLLAEGLLQRPGLHLQRVLVGGEAVDAATWKQLAQSPRVRFFNVYGPTECTVDASTCDASSSPDAPSIGRPLPGVPVYVLDAHLRPVPVGIPGELFIGGLQVARGYLHRPDLSAERFLPDAFSTTPGARMYRTGDLVRWGEDGQLDYLHRIDSQVKVRGFRIELGEVEAVLLQHPALKEAVVLARQDVPGDSRLVAYVVANAESPSLEALRDFVREHLPQHMVPSAFVVLERLPLTSNGKVNRRALPAPSALGSDEATFIAPRTDVEAQLAAIWARVLRVERVGARDNFFGLGGHSLLATQALSQLRSTFQVELPLRAFFEAPTLEALAARIAQVRAVSGHEGQSPRHGPPLTRQPREGALPLSFAQQRLWFLDQLKPGDASYNIPALIRIEGALDTAAFEKALAHLCLRHESLRTRFVSTDAGPVQIISELVPPLARIDLRALPESARAAEVQRIAAEEAQRPFDLAKGPLLRMTLMVLGDREHVLLATLHHIISDGWSAGIMVRELVALYQDVAAHRPPSLPELPVQYADYALWQRQWLQGEVLDAQLDYWRQQLDGIPALLELPTDRPRPAVLDFRGATVHDHFPREVTAPLFALALQEQATPFMALLAVFQLLLSRYSGQDDVSVGSPISGRTRQEMEPLIGFFVNTLVLRGRIDPDTTFRQWLRQTSDTALGAYSHQELPFERLVEELNPQRSLAHTPLFQVMLVLQNQPRGTLELPGLDFHVQGLDSRATKFDLTLQLGEDDTGLAATVSYNAELFDAGTLTRMLKHLKTLLVAAASQPDVPLSQLTLLTDAERHRLLVEWNTPRREALPDATLSQLFEAQARRTPDAQAVTCGEAHLSFRELDARANQLAHRLRSLGIGPDAPVVLCLERSVEALVAILGTLKAGGAYVPVDPSYPREWKEFVLRDTQARVLLTQRHLLGALPEGPHVLCLGADGDSFARESTDAPVPLAGPDNLAYVIYTSGSTGRPKGVMIQHRSVLHLRQALASTVYAGTSGPLRVSINAPLSFDASVKQLLQVLDGHTLCFVLEEERGDISLMLRRIEQERLDVLDCSPAHLRLLLSEGLLQRPGLRLQRVLVGGEAVDAATWKQLAQSPRVRFFNVYGPTECTVDASTCDAAASPDAPSIGRPLPGVPVYVLDAHLRPVPVGIPGELFIGGLQVARGYLHRPDLSAERFLPDAFSTTPGARMYRTGDLVRWGEDGQLDYLHRIDSQVKVRGFRIELGEVEAVLLQHPALKEAVVLARQDVPGDSRLVAYVVANAESPSLEALRDFMRQHLPQHMVPSAFVVLERLPLTSNGKVNRRALPAPSALGSDEASFIAPRTDVEAQLAAIWARVLRVERVGARDNFFGLGGHSLLATQALSQLRSTFQVELPLRAFFEAPTLEALAARIAQVRAVSGMEGQSPRHGPPLTRQPREGALPLSFAQQRLWFLDQLKPGDYSYNIPAALRLSGSLDTEALRRAFEEVVHRHESLRTTFATHQGAPQQLVHPPASWALPLVDLSTLPAEHREAQAMELAVREARTPFALSTGPLLRTQLLKLSASEHLLLVCMHHIVSDGWSIGVLVQEVAALYAAFLQGQPSPLPQLPVQYADFAVWQRQWLQGDALQAQLDYWHQRLQGAPTLALPTDKPRPSLRSHRGATLSFALPSHLTGALHALAQDSGSTLFMVLLAAFQTLLARYSGQDDISVGSPIANRTRQETEPLIGFFVNTLVLRSKLDADPLFTELLARVKESALSAYAHQDVPFEQLVEALGVARDLSRSPLFQVAFSYQSAPTQPPSLPGLHVEGLSAKTGTAKFDLSLFVTESAGVLHGQLEYCVDLFEHGSMERFAGHFASLIQGIAANPHRPLSQLPPEAPLQLPLLQQQAPTTGSAPAAFVAPRTPMEETLAAIWTEVLDVPAPGIHDNFFQLGGASLTSVLMLARVQEALGTDIPLERFFEAPSIAALAAALESAPAAQQGAHAPKLVRQPREGALPLSFAQQRLWFLDQLKPGDFSYNIPAALRLSGSLNTEALRRAFEEVVYRHEALRTTFPTHQGAPQQLIHPPASWALPLVDLSTLPTEQREAQAMELAVREARTPFVLSTGPLLRTRLLKLDVQEHLLLVCMHHIVSDGWSIGVLVQEVAALYAAFLQGQPSPLPQLPVQYADYAVW